MLNLQSFYLLMSTWYGEMIATELVRTDAAGVGSTRGATSAPRASPPDRPKRGGRGSGAYLSANGVRVRKTGVKAIPAMPIV